MRLSLRALNRAALARQHLLERTALPTLDLVGQLVGLQAIDADIGLWSRQQDAWRGALPVALADRELVSLPLMGRHGHVVTARDALAWWPVVRSDNWSRWAETRDSLGIPAATQRAVLDESRAYLRSPRTGAQVRAHLARRWPGHNPVLLVYVTSYGLPLVRVYPDSGEGLRSQLLDAWLQRTIGSDPAPDGLVRRFLAASGPASVAQIALWSGLSEVGAALERLRPELRTFTDEQGTELFDVPGGPLPDPDTPAPPRLLPDGDVAWHLHVHRPGGSRFFHSVAGQSGLFLVDGFLAGRWQIDDPQRDRMRLEPFARLTRDQQAGLYLEAERLLAFLLPPDAVRAPHVTFGTLRELH